MIEDYRKLAVQVESELLSFIQLLHRESITSYLEIGAKWGGTVWRVTNAVLPPGSRIVAVDMQNWMGGSFNSSETLQACVKELRFLGYDARAILGDSHSSEVATEVSALGPYEAVFIDGDHSAEGVRQDWENYGPMARIVAFHDIANNSKKQIKVREFWNELKKDYRHIEIKANDWYCGIGVLWR